MKTFALGLGLTFACFSGGCASSSAFSSAGTSAVTSASAKEAAPVTLTSAHADETRFSLIARPVATSSDEDLRHVAALKSRCEASNDDDACMLIARSRMR